MAAVILAGLRRLVAVAVVHVVRTLPPARAAHVLTTVGFGDIVPSTALGQALATLVMITGYSIIAVPTGIFTAELANAMRSEGHIEHPCPNCDKAEHDTAAAFCNRCGHALFPHRAQEPDAGAS